MEMKKTLVIAFILLLAIPALGKDDAQKKDKVLKSKPAKKVAAFHPIKKSSLPLKHSKLPQPRGKNTGGDSQIADQNMQNSYQKSQQNISTLSKIARQQSANSMTILHNMK
jgi:hypothetical protein